MAKKGFILTKFPLISFTVVFAFGIYAASFLHFNVLRLSALCCFVFLTALSLSIYVDRRDRLKTTILIFSIFIFSLSINSFRSSNVNSEIACMLNADFRSELIVKKLYNRNSMSQSAIVVDLVSKKKYLSSFPIDDSSSIKRGDTFYVIGRISDLTNIEIPNRFNFTDYLKRNGIYKQLHLNNYFKTENNDITSISIARTIERKIENSKLSEESMGMIKALVLGQKDDISKNTLKSFSDSGIMHLLALSGLHIGILTWLLSFLLRPFLVLKKGEIYRSAIIVILLWSYAYLTGFSSSILRATVMFSVFTIANGLKRGSNVYNSIAVSALILLIINPNNLFEVGFQLSFTAVIGIVWMFPMLESLWMPRNRIGKYFWGLVLVSIVAQVATLALSLFYFHKFSGLFLLANIIEIPLVSALLVLSYLFIILLTIGFPFIFIAEGIDFLVDLIRNVSEFISSFKSLVFDYLYLESIEVVVLYVLIIVSLLAIQTKRVKYIFSILFLIITLQVMMIISNYNKYSKSELMIVGGKYPDIILREGNNYFTSRDVKESKFHNYVIANDLSSTDSLLPKLFYSQNMLYWQLDKLSSSNPIGERHCIIVGNDSKANPRRLINEFSNFVILTAYSQSITKDRWEYYCSKESINVYCANDSIFVNNSSFALKNDI
ncbi:MAG: ComEC/Rec2 family competence protein [Flavobacteriales bacterium]|nr:ComEC/Rec2 family competence protein [Flavobacteriales bacterium]